MAAALISTITVDPRRNEAESTDTKLSRVRDETQGQGRNSRSFFLRRTTDHRLLTASVHSTVSKGCHTKKWIVALTPTTPFIKHSRSGMLTAFMTEKHKAHLCHSLTLTIQHTGDISSDTKNWFIYRQKISYSMLCCSFYFLSN